MEEIGPRTAAGGDPGRYRSYLVRLWREAPGEPWRCHVRCVATGLERRFAALAELFEFLAAEAGGEPATAERRTMAPRDA
jgi:hypothetical protein